MTRTVFFTSAAANYLPKTRLLCRSIKRFYPDAQVILAFPDEKPIWLDLANEPFDKVLDIADLGIPDARKWIFFHSIVELATAIKPFTIRYLLGSGAVDAVVYFDPDMVLFSPVDDILELLQQNNLVLTPHQTKPESSLEAVVDNEICSLKHGIYNLGFIGVRNTDEGRRFVDWWSERTYHFCRAAICEGLFTDQKWVDFAPAFFEGVGIIKSSRHNVATWNVTTREVKGSLKQGITVDGDPLGFYHFTGFDSGAHRIMADKNAAGNRTIAELVSWYEHEMETAKDAVAEGTPWAYRCYSDGEPIESCHRTLYRNRKDLQEAFPDPFAAGSSGYPEWLRQRGSFEYPELLDKGGHCLPGALAALQPVVHGCRWWLKRLVSPGHFLATVRYIIKRRW